MIWLEQLLALKLIRPIDAEFARFILYSQGVKDEALALLVTLLSVELGHKNVCLDLSALDFNAPFGLLPADVQLPALAALKANWQQIDCIATVQSANEVPTKPLVCYKNRLYLQRYWQYEVTVAERLRHFATKPVALDRALAKTMLSQLFAAQVDIDRQKVACTMALIKDFAVITGGPGTGKTTTVTKLLVLLIAQHLKAHQHRPVIKLVTPTGKAAARLSESIKGAKARLSVAPQVIANLPDTATTIHRLLGVKHNSSNFVHNRDNPLHLDVLVVDEVSMVDLPMMAKLLEALPENAKVVMLGDKDQLASVEAGSVLADICGQGKTMQAFCRDIAGQIEALAQLTLPEKPLVRLSLTDCICLLEKSHRFDDKSGIGQLAQAVNRGDIDGALHLERSGAAQLSFRDIADNDYLHLINHSARAYQVYLQMMKDKVDAKCIIDQFNRYQVLCAMREGEYGVSGLNEAIEKRLAQMGMIEPKQQFYAGRPIMIAKNDYALQLYNGDIGVILPDEQSGHLKAWFINSDGQVRSVYPNRLPAHDAVYAMTVHKSQGSEFDEISFVLPSFSQAQGNKVLSRELVYTGITRAKKQLNLFAQKQVLNLAINERTSRNSGLATLLYDD